MDESKIAVAVQSCVNHASTKVEPLRTVADFLKILCDSDWSRDELIEVRSRVLNQLGQPYSDARP